MSGGVNNISVSNVTIWDSAEGLRLKTGLGRGGFIYDVSMEHTHISNTKVCVNYASISTCIPCHIPSYICGPLLE